MKLFHAHLDTANFEFDVYGETEAHAVALMLDAWNAHAYEYRRPSLSGKGVKTAARAITRFDQAPGTYALLLQDGDVALPWTFEVRPIVVGALYRDREELKRQQPGATFPVVHGGKIVRVSVPEE